MSGLLTPSLHAAVHRSTSQVCSAEHISALFHTSARLEKIVKRKPAGQKPNASRRRLVDDLKPTSPRGRLEVAPRPRFARDSTPHTDESVLEQHKEARRNPSFRRHPGRTEHELDRRRGTWSTEVNEGASGPRAPRKSEGFRSRGREDARSPSGSATRRADRTSDNRKWKQTDVLSPRGRDSSSRYQKPYEPRNTRGAEGYKARDNDDYRRPDRFGDSSSRYQKPHESRDARDAEGYKARDNDDYRRPDRFGDSSSRYQKPHESRDARGAEGYKARDGDDYRRPDRQTPYQDTQRSESFRPREQTDSSRSSEPPSDIEKLTSHKPAPLDEFYYPPKPVTTGDSASSSPSSSAASQQLPTHFSSPPIMQGILNCLQELLPRGSKPTPIQALSMKWLLENDNAAMSSAADKKPKWREVLLASETGSGKSIAYLLPVLQHLKQSELSGASSHPLPPAAPGSAPQRALNPRALILAPTHELSRQLSGFAKGLLHEVKLRVLCASRANAPHAREGKDAESSRAMATQYDAMAGAGEFEVKKGGFPVDVVVGTPMKVLEMVRGRGWDRMDETAQREMYAREKDGDKEDEESSKLRRGRDRMPGVGKWRAKAEMGLANVEWVVVDEADVLFDPDFIQNTLSILSDIAEARGVPVPIPPTSTSTSADSTPAPINYPFSLLLTSATIPASLASHLSSYHPSLLRLASPNLHRLPNSLKTEHVSWTGGNKFSDIERRVRMVWAEDASSAAATNRAGEPVKLSKVLIFCNKSAKVQELGAFFDERNIKNVALTSTSDQRRRGSNHHLDGFLRRLAPRDDAPAPADADPKATPHVMITTSLLSRGLDFDPSIKHVFIVDEPRNMIDFIHRAGRSGRAGEKGKVVVFGKMKGRGSGKAKEVRKRVGLLTA